MVARKRAVAARHLAYGLSDAKLPSGMSKPVIEKGLGKGLGKLMGGDPIANFPQQSNGGANLGRGVSTLLKPRAENGIEDSSLPTWFFYGADLLLLFLSVAVAFASPKPLTNGTILFCGLSIAFGAMLSIMGVLKDFRS